MNFDIQKLEKEKEELCMKYIELMKEKRRLIDKMVEIENIMKKILKIEKKIHKEIKYYHLT